MHLPLHQVLYLINSSDSFRFNKSSFPFLYIYDGVLRAIHVTAAIYILFSKVDVEQCVETTISELCSLLCEFNCLSPCLSACSTRAAVTTSNSR